MKYQFFLVSTLLCLIGCKENTGKATILKESEVSITQSRWGSFEGSDVLLYTLTNSSGIKIVVSNYGALLQSLQVPDQDGRIEDIVLGSDSLMGYISTNPYFGATIGRYGNRIANGKFSLNGKEYSLAINNGINHLHGGIKSFNKVLWSAKEIEDGEWKGVEFSRLSPDMEEGYPGNLTVSTSYYLNDNNEIRLTYAAISDDSTVVNLTNHSYFNLSGQGSNTDITDHVLMIKASKYNPVNSDLIPIGIADVDSTPFDFRSPIAIGARINENNEQLSFGKGYDHNFVLDKGLGSISLVATLVDPKSGRKLEISTTEPGLQFYSGNFLTGNDRGKNGIGYKYRTGLCLETQHFPDSPNQPSFPSTVLVPGQKYSSETIWKFSVEK